MAGPGDLNWCLVSLAVGPCGRQEFDIVPGENVVGRKRDAFINLPHLDVSREQCAIFLIDDTLALIDRGSRNGTFVNGQKVPAGTSVTLFHNDTIGFGAHTSTVEKYDPKTKSPFLVYRIAKRISPAVLERLTKERQQSVTNSTAKRVADPPGEIPSNKRIRSDYETQPGPAAVSSISRPSTEVSSTVQELVPRNGSSTQVSSTREGLVEFFVVDDSSSESSNAPSAPENQTSKPIHAGTTSEPQTSIFKSVDDPSTLQTTGQNSALEAGTPSFRNNSKSTTNDDTRSITKSQSKPLSTVGSSAKKPAAPSTSSHAFKAPEGPRQIKKELFTEPLVCSSMLVDPDDSKHSEFPTFSLISDDEDDDDLILSSQMFVKNEESQSVHQTPETMDTSVLDEEVIDVYDSDDESFFDQVLSQSLSQSILLSEKEELKKSEKEEKKTKKEDKKSSKSHKADSKGRSRSRSSSKKDAKKKEDSKSKSSMDEKKHKSGGQASLSKQSSSSKSVSKMDVDEVPVENKPKTRKQHKDADALRDAQGSSKTSQSGMADAHDSHEDLRTVAVGVSRSSIDAVVQKSSSDMLQDTVKSSSSKNKIENKIQKLIDGSKKQKETAKKTLMVEPHTMPSSNKENKCKPAPEAVGVDKKKRRVTFSEQIGEVKEFECLGNMKKISTMPTHLLKEHPTKIPALQWNGLLLRGCPQVSDICQWNLKWFQEFQKVDKDPELFPFQPNPIENRFKTFSEYHHTMLTLVFHELWSELCRIHIVQTETNKFNLFSGVIEHVEPNCFDARTLFARCKIVTSGESSLYIPNFGDLVGVQILTADKEPAHLYESFGVVARQYSKERLQQSREANSLAKNLAPSGLGMDKVVVCPIEVLFRASRSRSNVGKDCVVRFRVYKNIMNQVKYFLALRKVLSSPLQSVILDPTKAVKGTSNNDKRESKIPISSGQVQLVDSDCGLNHLQKEAVDGIAHSVLDEQKSICLIHGPPGTGKSSAITHLIRTILPCLRKSSRKGPPAKILLCAPSNTAIDELCLKLLETRKKMSEDERFKLTRVGNLSMMHPQVVEIASVNLARRGLRNTPDPESLQTEISLLSARIQGLRTGLAGSRMKPSPDREIQTQKYRDLIEKHETRLAYYRKTLANIKSGRAPTNPCEDRKLLYQEECAIISGAEIIATTLCSSSSKKISDALSDSTQFACCIIDEATQATEPEVLIPLHHDIRHLVLVGDPQQLGPTVTSKFAKERNFEWSLYHRMMGEWKQSRDKPLYPLREQYRMHPEIAAFPSAKFYNSELITAPCLQFTLPFPPYYVISHPWPENEEANEKEARFIIELIQKLRCLEDFRPMSLGVIVPYHTQRGLIGNGILER